MKTSYFNKIKSNRIKGNGKDATDLIDIFAEFKFDFNDALNSKLHKNYLRIISWPIFIAFFRLRIPYSPIWHYNTEWMVKLKQAQQ